MLKFSFTIIATARILQDTYPEVIRRILVIRAPAIFKLIWGLVQHFFDQELRQLMIFASGDKDSQEVMEKYIDKDVLPHVLHPGGRDGPLARGYEHIVPEGGPLPPPGVATQTKYERIQKMKEKQAEKKHGAPSLSSAIREIRGNTADFTLSDHDSSCCQNALQAIDANRAVNAAPPQQQQQQQQQKNDIPCARVNCQRLFGGSWDVLTVSPSADEEDKEDASLLRN